MLAIGDLAPCTRYLLDLTKARLYDIEKQNGDLAGVTLKYANLSAGARYLDPESHQRYVGSLQEAQYEEDSYAELGELPMSVSLSLVHEEIPETRAERCQ